MDVAAENELVWSKAQEVGRWIQSQGYVVARNLGDAVQSDEEMRDNSLGILMTGAAGEARRWIAEVHFRNHNDGANIRRWVVKALGTDMLPRVTDIANEMKRVFDVDVAVIQGDLEPVFERYRQKRFNAKR